jgi:predicted N-acetyltransferase YhbS
MGEGTLEVEYLADCPEWIGLLASWFYEEWGHRHAGNTVENVEERLKRLMNRDEVPLALVAFRGTKPAGSASLIVREMETHPHYLHWLASVYIHHTCRNQGLGSQLVQRAASEAKRLGVQELYLYTRSHERFYARLGWGVIERPHYHGREVAIMKRSLV